MQRQLFALVFSSLVPLVASCGGESGSSPPPAYPAPPVPSQSADTPEDGSSTPKPAETTPTSTGTSGQTPSGDASNTAQKDKPVSNDKPAPADATSSAAGGDAEIPDANVTVGRLEADGLVTTNIVCKSEGGGGLGLLSMMLVTAWMTPYKKALDACAPAGKEIETRVVWRSGQGTVKEIAGKSESKNLNACIERTLRPGKPLFEGHCAATIVHGKKK